MENKLFFAAKIFAAGLYFFGTAQADPVPGHSLQFYKALDGKATPIFKSDSDPEKCSASQPDCLDTSTFKATSQTVLIDNDKDTKVVGDKTYFKVDYYEIDQLTSQCLEQPSPNEPSINQFVNKKLKDAVLQKRALSLVFAEIDSKLAGELGDAEPIDGFIKSNCFTHGAGWVDSSSIEPADNPIKLDVAEECKDPAGCGAKPENKVSEVKAFVRKLCLFRVI